MTTAAEPITQGRIADLRVCTYGLPDLRRMVDAFSELARHALFDKSLQSRDMAIDYMRAEGLFEPGDVKKVYVSGRHILVDRPGRNGTPATQRLCEVPIGYTGIESYPVSL